MSVIYGSRLIRRRARHTASVALALAFVVAGCTPSPADNAGQSPADSAGQSVSPPTESRSLTLAVEEEPRSLASWEAFKANSYPILRNVEEALVNRDPATNELVGELATSWEVVNPTTWRFHLREGVKFHDGSPFDAEAAAFALNYTWSKDNAFEIRVFIGPEMTARATASHTLEVETETPDPLVPSRLYISPIFSKQSFEADPESYNTVPVGTGPYRFDEWTRGQSVKLERNDDWWGETASDAGGRVTIPTATFVFRTETEVRTSALLAGEVQFARWLTKEQCERTPQCIGGPGVESLWVRPDIPYPMLKDRRIREAIALAIDKDAIINDLAGGGTLASMIVGPSAVGFVSELQPYPYDPSRAATLVQEAIADGVRVDDPLTLVTKPTRLAGPEGIQLIAQELKEVGFPNVRTEIRESAKYEEMWSQQPPPADRGVLGFDSHSNEIMDLAATAGSYYTCGGYGSTICDQDLDRLISAALPLAGDERKVALEAVARHVYDNVYTIPIGYPNLYFGLDSELNWRYRLDGLILLKEISFT